MAKNAKLKGYPHAVGITASAVFLTSIASGILISSKNNVQESIFRTISPKTKYEGKKTAEYIGGIVKEIEPGGSLFSLYITEFRNLAIYMVTFFIINGALFLIEKILTVLEIVSFSKGVPFFMMYLLHGIIFIICGALAVRSLDKIISKTISTFRKTESSTVELNKKLLYKVINLIIVLVTFFVVPVVLSLLRLPSFFNHIALVPLIIAVFIIWDIVKMIHYTITKREEKRTPYLEKVKKGSSRIRI